MLILSSASLASSATRNISNNRIFATLFASTLQSYARLSSSFHVSSKIAPSSLLKCHHSSTKLYLKDCLPIPSSKLDTYHHSFHSSKKSLSTQSSSNTALFMSSDDTTDNLNENENQYIKTVESQWNIPELKKETSRLILRAHKKIDKASKRLSNAQSILEDIRTKPNPTLEELESCPNMTLLEQELTDIQTRLQSLNTLEQMLASHGSKSKSLTVLPLEIASLAIQLQVNDMPPPRNNNPNRTPKVKGPREKDVPPRKPYFSYYTKNNTEIRVGRRAIDNDELSCNPLHRDSQDWWMHASGCPGSHIVIRCHDNSLDDDVIMDAASLAARQSKCTGAIINVSLTRCRDVKKPPGAKAGLVQLTGKVTTVSVNMKKVEDRLVRLDATCSNSQ